MKDWFVPLWAEEHDKKVFLNGSRIVWKYNKQKETAVKNGFYKMIEKVIWYKAILFCALLLNGEGRFFFKCAKKTWPFPLHNIWFESKKHGMYYMNSKNHTALQAWIYKIKQRHWCYVISKKILVSLYGPNPFTTEWNIA